MEGDAPMDISLYDLCALMVCGANGGLAYWAISQRRTLLAWVRRRAR